MYRVITDKENPEITCKVLFVAKHLLGKNDFNTMDLKNGWEMFAQSLRAVKKRFFPLKTRGIFSSRMHPSWITRKIQIELRKTSETLKKIIRFQKHGSAGKIQETKIKVQQIEQKC